MDPDKALELAEELAEITRSAEDYMLGEISKRVSPEPLGAKTKDWVEAKLAELNTTAARLNQAVQVLDELSAEQIEEKIIETYKEGLRDAVLQLGSGRFPIRGRIPRMNLSAVSALRDQTMGLVHDANIRILRRSLDQYRAVVADAARLSVSGAMTRQQATQYALNKWADHGVTSFVDKAGKTWSMDSYAEMSLRTATTRAHLEGRLTTLTAAGIDLFIVSDSPEECPLCRPWEGKILSVNRTRDYPTIDDARSAGLWHSNCTHTLNAYTPGMETLLRKPQASPRAYEERQRQRELERNLRRWKRRKAVAQSRDEERKMGLRVSAAEARLRQFTQRTGRQRVRTREEVSSDGRRLFTSRLRLARSPTRRKKAKAPQDLSQLTREDKEGMIAEAELRLKTTVAAINDVTLTNVHPAHLPSISRALKDIPPGLKVNVVATSYSRNGMPDTAWAAWTGRKEFRDPDMIRPSLRRAMTGADADPEFRDSIDSMLKDESVDGIISLNADKFIVKDADKQIAQNAAIGWWVARNPGELIDHEVGHAVYDMLKSQPSRLRGLHPDLQEVPFSSTFTQWWEGTGKSAPLSSYSKTDLHEGFAEWYAASLKDDRPAAFTEIPLQEFRDMMTDMMGARLEDEKAA